MHYPALSICIICQACGNLSCPVSLYHSLYKYRSREKEWSVPPIPIKWYYIALSPGHSQILSRSHGEKSGEGLGSKLRHGPEMVDSVSTNWVHVTYWPSPPFPVHDIVLIPGFLLIFLHGCEIKSGNGLGTRLGIIVLPSQNCRLHCSWHPPGLYVYTSERKCMMNHFINPLQ